MIQSLLDLDYYKLTMGNFVYHQRYNTSVEYEFVCRNKGIDFSSVFSIIKKEIKELEFLTLSFDEIKYLRSLNILSHSYIDSLCNLRLLATNEQVICNLNIDGSLSIKINGFWHEIILYETLILSIVNEAYFNQFNVDLGFARKRLDEKIKLIKESHSFKFSDFGTRRRFSSNWHDEIIGRLIKEVPENFIGTSNIYLAKKYNVKPIGTMAHELISAYQAFVHPINSQRVALTDWIDFYAGKLGIALTDTLGLDKFLQDFDWNLADRYSGVRHDSGNPYLFTEKILEHYSELEIDSRSKTIVYSDGLDFPKALAIHDKYKDKANTMFGIGTNLTNQTGVDPLNIVIKLTKVNDLPVAKISDEPSKAICKDENYLKYLKSILHLEG